MKLEPSVRAEPAFNYPVTFPSLKDFLNHLKNRLVLCVILEETTGTEGCSWFGEMTVAFFTLWLGLSFPTSTLVTRLLLFPSLSILFCSFSLCLSWCLHWATCTCGSWSALQCGEWAPDFTHPEILITEWNQTSSHQNVLDLLRVSVLPRSPLHLLFLSMSVIVISTSPTYLPGTLFTYLYSQLPRFLNYSAVFQPMHWWTI